MVYNFILNNLIRQFKRCKKSFLNQKKKKKVRSSMHLFVCLFVFFPVTLREDKVILVKILNYVIKKEKGKKKVW